MSDSNKAANRRAAIRHKAKTSARVSCATGKMGMGPNVAVTVLDVSETGVRLILKAAQSPGNELELSLEAPGDRRPTKVPAQVVWCAALADGNHCIGARFLKPIPYAILQALVYM